MRILQLLVVLFALPTLAWAGDVSVVVRDRAGKPVPNAVVTVYPAAGLPAGPIKFPWPYVLAQENIQFTPFVLIVPVGADVVFPNHDKVRHHVYSFSAGNKFELKLYGHEEKRSVRFKAAGVAAIGCNIHDQMTGFIQVVETPYALKTDATGAAVLRGVPGGAATLKVWHPYLRAPKNELTKSITVPASGVLRDAPVVDLRPAPAMSGMQH
jgi:hypothetical protein